MIIVIGILEIAAIATAVLMFMVWIEHKQTLNKTLRRHKENVDKAAETYARKSLPVIQQVDPVVVYKRAYVLDNGELAGIGYYQRYKPYDEASCGQNHDHKVPAVTCTCGFWGLPSPEDLRTLGTLKPCIALLEVEFFGEIIHLEQGYRSAKQRILSMQLQRTCTLCYEEANHIISIRINSDLKPEWHLFGTHVPADDSIIPARRNSAAASSMGPDSPLMPFCDSCATKLRKMPEEHPLLPNAIDFIEWSLADIANKFQVEAKWDNFDYVPLVNKLTTLAKFSEIIEPSITVYHEDTAQLFKSLMKGH